MTNGPERPVVAPAADLEAAAPAGAFERAALDLAVAIDALGHAVDRFIDEQQRAHRRLMAATDAVCAAASGPLEPAALARLRATLVEAAR